MGEITLEIGAPGTWGLTMTDPANLQVALQQMRMAAAERSADLTVLRERTLDTHAGEGAEGTGSDLLTGVEQCGFGACCFSA